MVMTNQYDYGTKLSVTALGGIPLISPGDDLAQIILDALDRMDEGLVDGDILVLAQKIVSKSEDRMVKLDSVTPSAKAIEVAEQVDKDPRFVELVLSEAMEIVQHRQGVLIVTHHKNGICHNAGIDMSNVGQTDGEKDINALLLPEDSDASCARLQQVFKDRAGVTIGIIINDSQPRAWRKGTVGVAIGSAGIETLVDFTGKPDLFNRRMRHCEIATGDELAATASLLMGQCNEGRPVVLIRGLEFGHGQGCAADLVRFPRK
jgi:coenzyme F420-0:L-glutamate ligase/coenzyme F420-1:gamma-L-glutamate ligase